MCCISVRSATYVATCLCHIFRERSVIQYKTFPNICWLVSTERSIESTIHHAHVKQCLWAGEKKRHKIKWSGIGFLWIQEICASVVFLPEPRERERERFFCLVQFLLVLFILCRSYFFLFYYGDKSVRFCILKCCKLKVITQAVVIELFLYLEMMWYREMARSHNITFSKHTTKRSAQTAKMPTFRTHFWRRDGIYSRYST